MRWGKQARGDDDDDGRNVDVLVTIHKQLPGRREAGKRRLINIGEHRVRHRRRLGTLAFLEVFSLSVSRVETRGEGGARGLISGGEAGPRAQNVSRGTP